MVVENWSANANLMTGFCMMGSGPHNIILTICKMAWSIGSKFPCYFKIDANRDKLKITSKQ